MIPDLAAYLLARYDEAEKLARAAICPCGGPACTLELGWIREGEAVTRLDDAGAAAFVVANAPAAVLADLEAKRAIVAQALSWEGAERMAHLGDGEWDHAGRPGEAMALEQALRHLSTPYAGRDDYDTEWRPTP